MNTEKTWNKTIKKNWAVIFYLFASPLAAIAGTITYSYFYGIHFIEIFLFLFFYFVSGLGVTAGYHRYYSHRTHDCHPIIEVFYLIFGGIAFQQPVLKWARNHRIHHRYVDTKKDPHNIREGFFHAHMGWIFSQTELDEDYSYVSDLQKNKLVLWQQKYYPYIAITFGVLLPTFIGWLFDRALGGFLWGCLLRAVAENHVIFSINSFAHYFGKQKYSLKTEARDSWLLALISNGEGFHSFHHRFAFDYRNGYKWYHWDPSKWFILFCSKIGLTAKLKTASESSIIRARMETDIKRIQLRFKSMPQEISTKIDQQLLNTKKNFDTIYQNWQKTKEQYKYSSKQEKLKLKRKMKSYKKELQTASANWTSIIASFSYMSNEKLLHFLQSSF